MLDKHLIAACFPVADEANIIKFKNYRVTVLADRLFRIECDKDGIFTDEATQSVWFRNMPKQKFAVSEKSGTLKIKTDKVTLVLADTIEDSYVLLGRKKVAINNEQNLLGTYRTLDGCEGGIYRGNHQEFNEPLQLEMGVISKNGVAVFDDTKTLILRDDGKIYARRETEADIYVFAYGKEYRDALNALYMITGSVPKIPKFALGNWWSRYYAYTDKEYLHLLDKFDDANVPLTVATIDMDWHYAGDLTRYFDFPEGNEEDYNTWLKTSGWTGYSWNKELFPDYKAFLKKIEEKNLKITLNLHPASGVRFFEDQYEEMATAMGIDPTTKMYVPFNITDDNFINNYFKILHKPYERDGVHFWWMDWQQGTKTALAGLDPLWALNHYHYLDNGVYHEPLLLSRYSGIGSHRYPLGFSGDTYIGWKSLEYIPYFTATASNAGYTWWSHDIGGHFRGYKDDELYLRYVQFGVFSPINRLHCDNRKVNTKEPWVYMGGTGEIAKNYLRLRHKMLPFLYSASIKNHKLGLSLIEPMYYEYPECPEAYKYTSQYMFGGELLVAPITSKTDALGLSRTKVWLPEGKWTDIFTGDVYEGGRVIEAMRYLDEIPVFAKAGGTFVTSGDNNGNSLANPTKLVLDIYNGNGTYELYEDNSDMAGETVTTVTNTYADGVQTTTVVVKGDRGVVPEKREYLLRFPNIAEGKVTVNAKGKVEYEYDDNELITVKVSGNGIKSFTVTVEAAPTTELDTLKKMATKAMMRTQGDNANRAEIHKQIMACEDTDEYKQIIKNADLKSAYKKRLLELVK